MFKVAIYNVAGKKTDRRYTTEDMADLDIKTSNNLIGEIDLYGLGVQECACKLTY